VRKRQLKIHDKTDIFILISEIKLIINDLDIIDNSLSVLYSLEKDLIYNINLHKTTRVVTVLMEYKKSIEWLRQVQSDIIKSNNAKNILEKDLARKQKRYELYREESGNRGCVILPFRNNDEENN
jgi:hypothetical protein